MPVPARRAEYCDRMLSDGEYRPMALPASVPLALDEVWPEELLQAKMADYYQAGGSYGVCNEGITMAAG